MQKLKQELNTNPVGANCIRPHFEGTTIKNKKGITLIALIITIIVMLILVGVTINVALNGGLFEKAESATYKTEASLVKEQLEIAKAVEIANNGGKPLEDYSIIKVESLNIDESTKNKYKGKILVNTAGDICYNQETVTDAQEKTWLEEIGIKAYVNNTIPTIWQQRGVTSTNVKFDTLYYNGEEMERTDGTGAFFEGMTIGLHSNGDVCLNYNSDVISTKDSNGENNIGSNGAKSSDIDYYLAEGYGHCFDNGITMFLSADSGYITIRYTSSNTVNVYQGGTAELDLNGNVPENETCFIGTLLPQ